MKELIDELVEIQKTIEDTDFMSYDEYTRTKNQKNISLFYNKLDKLINKLKNKQFNKRLEIYSNNLQKKQ